MPTYTPELLAALALFAFVSSITPGPNNAMLMASGANHGFARTLPHLAGVSAGFFILIVAVGLGLGGLFAAQSWLHDVLRIAGGAYLLWLAWRIATSAPPKSGPDRRGAPFGFWPAAGFQWVNPKAWVMAVSAMTAFVPEGPYRVNMLAMALVFSAVNLPCLAIWTGGGVALRRLLARPVALRAFNWTMAALLAASLAPILMELLAT